MKVTIPYNRPFTHLTNRHLLNKPTINVGGMTENS